MMPNKKTVTIEDLIRLKRAERPPAEFWGEFEREMRVKQLAAIIEPRPWWAPFIRVGARFAQYQVPVGAAAILALSFVTMREYRTTDYSPRYATELEVAAPVLNQGALPEASMPAMASVAAAETEAAMVPALAGADENERAASATQVGYVSHTIPLPDLNPATSEPTPSARYIAANLAAAQEADPRLGQDVFGVSSRALQTREPVRDPLAQISASGGQRRSRLLEPALPVATSANVAVGSSDRVARRLTEDRLYDTISRIGVKGDRVAIKF